MGNKQYNSDELPVTLLAGCLGSGKTTLLNHILSQDHGKRIAVVENEFGEIPVDHELIIGADDDIFEMSNGCICCSVRTDLLETLGRLLKKQDRFDYILIEATGLASPGPIAQAFLVDEELPQALKLDGVVTLIDALHIQTQLEDLEVAWEQIAFSSVLVLNKVDLVPPRTLQEVEEKIRSINPAAILHKVSHAQVELDQLLNLGGFELSENMSLSKSEETHHHGEGGEEDVTSVSLEIPGKIDENRFQIWLQMLLIVEGMDVYRAKGMLDLPGTDAPTLFQSVYQMYDSGPGSSWNGNDPINRMVFIGRHLNAERLSAGIHTCLL